MYLINGKENKEYIKNIVKRNREALDIPKNYNGGFYEGVWYIICVNNTYCGGLGFVIYNDEAYLQVVIEEEFRGYGLFQEAFFLLQDLHPKINVYKLTTGTNNLAMQRAARKAGFDFIQTIGSLNKTGKEMLLYEFKK